MRILILNEADDYALGASYGRAFKSLDHEVEFLDPAAGLKKMALWRFAPTRRLFERRLIHRFNRRWLEQLLAVPADVIWVGKGAWALPWLWREIKRRKPQVRLVCYNADNPIITYSRGGNRPWITESISCFDLYCTYNQSLVEPLRQAGARQVACIPFAWDPWLHPELMPSETDKARYACDIIFVGNGDGHREKWMGDIIRSAAGQNWQIAIYGQWRKCRDKQVLNAIRGPQIYGREMVKTIRAAKICINILRVQNEGSHNMRTFEIAGCGGLMASQYSEEQDSFFPGDVAALYFRNTNEAVQKIAAVLAQPGRLESMRKQAHALAAANTYVHRAKALLAAVESIPN